MGEVTLPAITVSHAKDGTPFISRGEHPAWTDPSSAEARLLGRQATKELFALLPDSSDEGIISAAADLAQEHPPLPLPVSWAFYNGVRDGLDEKFVNPHSVAVEGVAV